MTAVQSKRIMLQVQNLTGLHPLESLTFRPKAYLTGRQTPSLNDSAPCCNRCEGVHTWWTANLYHPGHFRDGRAAAGRLGRPADPHPGDPQPCLAVRPLLRSWQSCPGPMEGLCRNSVVGLASVSRHQHRIVRRLARRLSPQVSAGVRLGRRDAATRCAPFVPAEDTAGRPDQHQRPHTRRRGCAPRRSPDTASARESSI